MTREAMFYHALDGAAVRCELCTHQCRIDDFQQGLCGTRENRSGKLYASASGNVAGAGVEPVEKRFLYHFLPGTRSFTVALAPPAGGPCASLREERGIPPSQNASADRGIRKLSPEDLVKRAEGEDCRSISYGVRESLLYYEWVFETAKLARDRGLMNIFFTGGFVAPGALETISPYLDACRVEVRFCREGDDGQTSQGGLESALDCVRILKKLRIWTEVTTTVRAGVNDGEKNLSGIARFIAALDPNTPWHIVRHCPDAGEPGGRLTPLETLWRSRSIGEEAGLRYVYIRNVLGEAAVTLCPHCGETVLSRRDFAVEKNNLAGSLCRKCGEPIAGVFAR